MYNEKTVMNIMTELLLILRINRFECDYIHLHPYTYNIFINNLISTCSYMSGDVFGDIYPGRESFNFQGVEMRRAPLNLIHHFGIIPSTSREFDIQCTGMTWDLVRKCSEASAAIEVEENNMIKVPLFINEFFITMFYVMKKMNDDILPSKIIVGNGLWNIFPHNNKSELIFQGPPNILHSTIPQTRDSIKFVPATGSIKHEFKLIPLDSRGTIIRSLMAYTYHVGNMIKIIHEAQLKGNEFINRHGQLIFDFSGNQHV